jgi:hypothetical protein
VKDLKHSELSGVATAKQLTAGSAETSLTIFGGRNSAITGFADNEFEIDIQLMHRTASDIERPPRTEASDRDSVPKSALPRVADWVMNTSSAPILNGLQFTDVIRVARSV